MIVDPSITVFSLGFLAHSIFHMIMVSLNFEWGGRGEG